MTDLVAKSNTTRNKMFDAIKGLAIISVVFSHTYRGYTDVSAILIREIAMWSVPAFFILQGFFMSKPANLKSWLSATLKKIKKAYVPFLVWSVFYGIFYLYVRGTNFTIEDVILGKTAIHLYFMFHFMVFALILPLMYFIQKQVIRKTILYFMIFSNLTLTIILEISKAEQIRIIPYSGPNPIKWWGFVALGMLVAESPKLVSYCKKHIKLTLTLATIMFMFGIIQPFAINHVGYLFNKFALWPMSIGLIIILLFYYSHDKAIVKKQLAYVGERTFGIYLPHILILYYLQILLPNQRLLSVFLNITICLLLVKCKNYSENKLLKIKFTVKST